MAIKNVSDKPHVNHFTKKKKISSELIRISDEYKSGIHQPKKSKNGTKSILFVYFSITHAHCIFVWHSKNQFYSLVIQIFLSHQKGGCYLVKVENFLEESFLIKKKCKTVKKNRTKQLEIKLTRMENILFTSRSPQCLNLHVHVHVLLIWDFYWMINVNIIFFQSNSDLECVNAVIRTKTR